jgi:hypothetical protein
VASYSYHTASATKITASSELEVARQLSVDAHEFRARAARYRHLADGLIDPQVIAEVYACARQLEIKAAAIEKLAAFELQTMLGARAEARQLESVASFRSGAPIACDRTTRARWIINSWCDFLDTAPAVLESAGFR